VGRIRLNPFKRRTDERQIANVSQYAMSAGQFGYGGNSYTYPADPTTTMLYGKSEIAPASPDFIGNSVTYRSNSIVGACLDIRASVFSAVRFQWQSINNGRPSKTFGGTTLRLLERPWVGATTQDLLSLMIQDADLAGNSYWVKSGDALSRLRPDWVDVVLEAATVDGGVIGYQKAGYIYTEGGRQSGIEPVFLRLDEVAHFMPRPDPTATWRGMSWMTPLIRREVYSDELMSEHKARFMENAATPNLVVRLDRTVSPEAFEKFKAAADASHKGIENAYKTMYVGGGADVSVVGNDMQQISFTAVQAAGESRIAAAAGVPPVLAGFSEGLQAATYSNYGQARRRFADGTIHPLWQKASGCLEHLVRESGLSSAIRLWYDSRDVPFLREDQEQAAEIQYKRALTVRQYVDAGYTPDSAIAAVDADDPTLLVHTGLFSVMLMPPGTVADKPSSPPADTAGTSDSKGSV
jgi:phage portal protein BeeE